MKDRELGLKFKASMEIGDMKKSISVLSKGLEDAGAKIPQGMSSSLSKLIKTLNSELTKIEGLTDIDLSPKDTKKVNQSYEKIFSTFQQIKSVLGDIKHSAKVDPEKFFPEGVVEKIDGATEALKKYNKAIKAGIKTDEYKQIGEDLKKANRELNRFKTAEENLDRKKQDLEGKRTAAIQKRVQTSTIVQDAFIEKENTEAEVERVRKRKKAAGRLVKIEEDLRKKRAFLAKKQTWAAKKEDEKQQYKGSQDDEKYKKIVKVLEGHIDSIVKLGDEIKKLEDEQAELKLFQPTNAQELEEAAQRAKDAGDEYKNALRAFEDANNEIEDYNKDISQTNIDIQVKSGEVLQAQQRVENLRKQKEQLEAEFKNKLFGTLVQELRELNIELPQTGVKIEDVEAAISKLGTEAKNNLAKALQNIEDPLGVIVPLLESMGLKAREVEGFGENAERAARDMENLKEQVLEFFSITNVIQIFKNAIRDAFDTIKELDAAMTETAVVTDFSIGNMWEKLPEYSKQATKLGSSIKSLYEATTLYYQQGLNSQQAMNVGIETMKMARIANMDAEAATTAMTAALRGFNMEINELSAQRINDVYSELAAVTAADTSQIAAAMSKTASIASSANMEFETTAALLAQIIETTQEAPETAGTAMKTIIARFTEVKELFSQGMLTGEDEEGEVIDINKIDAALKTVGISLKDFLNGSKGIDDIFLELASKWDTLDLATQRYIATTAAGSRQQSRFLAMMSNYDRTMELVNAATNSAGASQKQFEKTLDSLEAKLQRLSNAWDTFTMGLANNEVVKLGVDLLTKILELANSLTDDLGSTVGAITKLSVALAALKTGKSIFNSIFGYDEAEGILDKIKTFTNKLQAAKGESVDFKTKIKNALRSTEAWTKGLTAAGAAVGLFGQYLRTCGYEEAAAGFEKLGGVLILLSTIISTVSTAGPLLLAIPGPIMAIVTAVAALGVALLMVYNSSPGGKLKTAQKETKKAAEAAQEAANAYNNLSSSLNSIADKTTALDGLTKGTQEWREAVLALNNDVMALIETYPELAKFLTSDGGVLKIDYGKTITDKNGKKQTADDIIEGYFKEQLRQQQSYNQKQIEEKQAEFNASQYANFAERHNKKLEISDYEVFQQKVKEENKTAFDYRQDIIDELALALAEGKISIDEDSIQSHLQKFGLSYEYSQEEAFALKEYGQVLQSQQAAIDGFTDALFDASMSLANFEDISDETIDIVSNLDSDFLEPAYEKLLSGQITREDVDKYAEERGYVKEGNYYKKDGESVSITKEEVALYKFEDVLKNLANRLENSTEQEQKLFSEVFSEGTKNLSRKTLSQYGSYDTETGLFGFNKDQANIFAQQFDYKDFGDMTAELGVTLEGLNEIFAEGGAEFINVRKNLVKNMTKYSKGSDKNLDINAALLNALEVKYKDLDIASMMSNVFEQLDKTGDMNLSTAAYETLRDIMTEAEGAGQMQDAFDFFNKIDFNNPISALETINKELKTGSGHSVDLARAIKNSDSSFLGLSSQLSTFINSENFEDVKEDLDEIIEKNGEIAATDVLELSKSYKDLNKILNNNEVSAAALAKVLNGISNGTLQVEELTDTVLAAVSSFDSLDSIVAKTIQGLEDFDLGPDENEVGKTAKEWSELILENIKSGAVGNSQNFKILDYLFPGWDEGPDGDEIVAEMKRLANKIGGNGQNLRKLWSDLADGKDYKGNEAIFEGEGLTEEEKKKFKDLKVTDTGKEIQFTGWEGKGLTSDDLVTWIADAYGTSKEMASLMLVDFKNYSKDLAAELRENDFAVGMEKAYESLRQFGENKIIDQRELQTIAEYLGTTPGRIKEALNAYGDVITTDFYNIDGTIKSFEEIDKQLSDLGGKAGKLWSDAFFKKTEVESQGLYEHFFDLKSLEKDLASLGIVGTAAEELKRQAFESFKQGIIEGGEAGYNIISTTLVDGSETLITITPEMDYSQYEAEVEKINRRILNEESANAFVEAMMDKEVTAKINEKSFLAITERINKAFTDATTDIEPGLNPNKIEAGISTVLNRERFINLKANMNPVTIAASGVATGQITLEAFKKGVKNSNYSGPALVSEVGPELIQTKDGAYLTGLNGPELANINKGDTVYTAQETKKILKGSKPSSLPRFEGGKEGRSGTASAYGNGTAYGGGAGGKSNSENTLDKLYNLLKEIEAEGRQRERIERRYQYLIESVNSSVTDLIKVSSQELEVLERQRQMQENLRSRRRDQIGLYQQENEDLQKYAWFEKDPYGEDILQIDWQAIEAITDKTLGERVSAYVEQLEEWSEAIYDVEQELYDIEDQIKEIKERGREEYLEYEERVRDALVDSYEKEIEQLETINDSIVNTNNSVIKSIQNSLSESRKQRENQKTEQSIANKERRLAYLRQDTSSANALEILQLEKELQEEREGYVDTLIDDKIAQLQDQNDKAAEQRAQQIEIARAQLDHLVESGQIWKEVESLMTEGLDKEHGLVRGSRLESILKSSENFKGMSETQKVKWLEELEQDSKVVVAYIEGLKQEAKKPATVVDDNDYSGSSGGKTPNSSGGGGGGSGNGGNGGDGPKEKQDTSALKPDSSQQTTTIDQHQDKKQAQREIEEYDRKIAELEKEIQEGEKARTNIPKNNVEAIMEVDKRIEEKEKELQQLRAKRAAAVRVVNGFKTGGLADFTGPAWLDGTKSRPEYVLNADQTKRFFNLIDILDGFKSNLSSMTSQVFGGATYDIDINIDTVKEEADVDMIVDKVQKSIVATSKYRNNTFVKR